MCFFLSVLRICSIKILIYVLINILKNILLALMLNHFFIQCFCLSLQHDLPTLFLVFFFPVLLYRFLFLWVFCLFVYLFTAISEWNKLYPDPAFALRLTVGLPLVLPSSYTTFSDTVLGAHSLPNFQCLKDFQDWDGIFSYSPCILPWHSEQMSWLKIVWTATRALPGSFYPHRWHSAFGIDSSQSEMPTLGIILLMAMTGRQEISQWTRIFVPA